MTDDEFEIAKDKILKSLGPIIVEMLTLNSLVKELRRDSVLKSVLITIAANIINWEIMDAKSRAEWMVDFAKGMQLASEGDSGQFEDISVEESIMEFQFKRGN